MYNKSVKEREALIDTEEYTGLGSAYTWSLQTTGCQHRFFVDAGWKVEIVCCMLCCTV